jgi:hypothetical protein
LSVGTVCERALTFDEIKFSEISFEAILLGHNLLGKMPLRESLLVVVG